MLRRVKHKGLRLLWEKDNAKGVPAEFVDKLERILTLLNRGPLPDTLDLPGLKLHAMTGNRKGTWSVWVTRNYRVTFEIDGPDAINVDFEDYH